MRAESDIFADLEKLCISSGYVHVIAYFCWCDDPVKGDLTRAEISTLIGLLVKGNIDLTLPMPAVIQQYIDDTKKLLKELYDLMYHTKISTKDNSFRQGKEIRANIFYAPEAAYIFQYRDFCAEKYKRDTDWFLKNKGFSPEDFSLFISALVKIQDNKIKRIGEAYSPNNMDKLTPLPIFVFSKEEIADATGFNIDRVSKIIHAFSLKTVPSNRDFKNVSDFNETNAYPIIPLENGSYILFELYNIAEAFYETPFFWMCEDKAYCNQAMKNRGDFVEVFSLKRLQAVFGENRVYQNVSIVDSSEREVGEIDVLVIYADRAIIVQAKSKRLTIEARKGNDNQIKNDFKKAIQSAYNQGMKCAEFLQHECYQLIDKGNNALKVRRDYTEVFIFCVLSDYYPALTYQAAYFLEFKKHHVIRPPYVMDIFFLDILCEFLNTPLQFFNYIHRRLNYINIVFASDEITILSYHLTHNLWVNEKTYVCHRFAIDLDIAFQVRRVGLLGQDTPKGILTNHIGSFFGEIIKEIDSMACDNVLELGYFLLALDQKGSETISKACALILSDFKKTKKPQDFSIVVDNANAGMTIHCRDAPDDLIYRYLYNHCVMRKYKAKASYWYGLALNPQGSKHLIRLVIGLNEPWKKIPALEKIVMENIGHLHPNLDEAISKNKILKSKKKVGRNEPCPCGSGKKYKKCCLNNQSK